MDQGLKVPTEYIVRLSKKFIEENKDKHILMDGAIRSKEQNDAMEEVW
jgi:adenylate kinase family enzyme